MDDLSFLVPVGFVIFFALMVYWVVSSQRRQTEAKRLRAAKLGLTALATPPPGLLERLKRLRPFSAKEKPTLKNIFTRRLPDGTLYLFDLDVTSGGEDSSTSKDMLLVESTALHLPRFGIFPRPAAALPGLAGQFFDKLIHMMVSRLGLVVVPVSQPASFTTRYALLAESPQQVSGLIESGLLAELAALNHQHIQAEGDAFTYARLPLGQKSAQPAGDDLVSLIDEAQRILRILAEFRP